MQNTIQYLGCNKSSQGECLIFITFPVNTDEVEFHYPTWARLLFVPSLNLTNTNNLLRIQRTLIDALRLLQNTIQHLGCNQSCQGECLIFITFPVNIDVVEYHYPTWARLLFVATLNLTHTNNLLRSQRTLIQMLSGTPVMEKQIKQPNKETRNPLQVKNSLLKKNYKLSQQCT